MPTGQDRIERYYSPRPHSPPNAGQPRQSFYSLEQLLRQHHTEPSAAALTEFFIRKAIPHISESNPDRQGVEKFLMDVAPWRSARYLVPNLRDASSVEPILRVLAHYRASKDTVMPLVRALGDSDGRVVSAAERALVGYGRAALDFIGTPRPGTLYYKRLTEVRTAIISGQPGGVR